VVNVALMRYQRPIIWDCGILPAHWLHNSRGTTNFFIHHQQDHIMNSSTLRRLSINQLRSMASGHGLAHTVRSTKNDLIAVLSALINEPAFTPDRTPARSGREGARKESQFLSSVPPDLARPAPSSSAASVPLFGPPPHQPELSDPGLPIPPSYGRDRLVLMVLDTTHLFAYWEISGPTLSRVHIAIGDTT